MRTMDTEAVGLVVESLRSMRSVGDLCLITGAPGCGKTTALRRAMAELPEVKRVVLTPSPEGASPRAFFRDVAVRIGLQVNPSAGALDLALAVEQEVLSRRWLLVIDQCQRLPRTWLPCYRYLVDQLGGLVLCGTDAFRVRIEGYEDLASPMLPVQMPV
ncbi:MAG: ATP-binding protein, partial [Armatimonadetes bacterium]|nr:ATP-binding protein [Armatimonadota bacterium]